MSMFDTLLTMEASGGSSGGGGSEDLVAYEVAAITDKLSQRGRFDVPGIQMQYPVLYEESMNTVLAQECIRYNKLVDGRFDVEARFCEGVDRKRHSRDLLDLGLLLS